MNKFEMELNENKAKAFFVRHGEKLGLAVAAGLLGTFAYLGVGLKPELTLTPTSLEGTIKNAENHINNGRWSELQPHRLAIDNTVEKLDSNKVQVSASDFVFDYLLARRSASAPLRSDPTLLAVSNPETFVARVSVADTSPGRHPLSMMDPLELEASDGGVGAGPEMNDGKSNAKSGPKVDLGAVAAATGIDPTKAGLTDLSGAAPFDRYIATVKYVFPYKKVFTDFRNAFRSSMGYNASNDRFVIRYMEIQRRTNGGEWEDYTSKIREQEKTYVVGAPDPFDDKYALPVITRPFPPVLLHDYYGMSRHTMIPQMEVPKEDAEVAVDGTKGGSNTGRSNSGNSMSGRSGPPSGVSGRSGPPSGAGMSGRSGPPSGAGMSGRSGPPSGSMSGRSGMPSGGGSGSGQVTSMMIEEPVDLVDYKVVRFSDPTVEPGNSYEYRVRYWIFDPNNPIKMEGFVAKAKEEGPGIASMAASTEEEDVDEDEVLENTILQSNIKLDYLAPEVRERLKLEGTLERPLPVLRNCRPSPWSEPTAPIRVQAVSGDAFVSTATSATSVKSPIEDRVVEFSLREATIRAVVGIWDREFGMQIPMVLENALPGSVLGGTASTRVLDPITREYKKLENNDVTADPTGKQPGYKGSSGIVLVDFMGGREIQNGSESKAAKFRVPTEALLLDSSGELLVRSAVRDAGNVTWMSGEVLREDGLINKLAESESSDADSQEDEKSGKSGNNRGGRSGFPGGRPPNSGPPPGGGASGGRSGPPGGGGGRSAPPGN
ncbi:MAG: hypothetical protein JNL67_06160 [Planctomycetaceae bacterium]|nr:hypothetical protein [Planctomycetaceae bacterium]